MSQRVLCSATRPGRPITLVRAAISWSLAVVILIACGGPGGGGSGTNAPPTGSASVSRLVVAAMPQAPNQGNGPWTVVVAAVDASGNPTTGTQVNIAATSGQLSQSSLVTDANGTVSLTVSPSGAQGTQVAAVKATAGTQTAVVDILFQNQNVQLAGLRSLRQRSRTGHLASAVVPQPFVIGTSTATSDGGVFFNNPNPCYGQANPTPSAACQQVFKQNGVRSTVGGLVRGPCQMLEVVATSVGGTACVGTAVLLSVCLAAVLSGPGQPVICAGAIELAEASGGGRSARRLSLTKLQSSSRLTSCSSIRWRLLTA